MCVWLQASRPSRIMSLRAMHPRLRNRDMRRTIKAQMRTMTRLQLLTITRHQQMIIMNLPLTGMTNITEQSFDLSRI
jgi:hypothetical protein